MFLQFHDFSQHFVRFHLNDGMGPNDSEEAISKRSNRLKIIRMELEKLEELDGVELAQITNLRPTSKEMAMALIPSLARLVDKGRQDVVTQAIEIVLKNRD